jgi:sugar O-acyltransferase (sialic acid O-acetyltransferase NeuD family)
MGSLVLVAASGLAREALATLRATGKPVDAVVLDDDPARHGTELSGVDVVGGLEDVKRYDTSEVLVCAGKGSTRRALVDRLSDLGVGPDRYATVVHPSVQVPDSCVIGAGSLVLAGVVLTADVRLGGHVVVMPHVTLTHDDMVEDFATLCAGVTLGGSVRVGTSAYVGMSASVRENVTVGAESLLGMGSVLLHDLPAGETWAGCPASRLPLDGECN